VTGADPASVDGPAPDAAADAAIEIRGLVKRYGERAVVDGIDLTVARGEVVALLGPNGAGKTTTVEIVEGYRRADAGRIRVLGLDPVRDATRLRPRVGLMLQGGGIYQYGRPGELVRLFASFYRDPADPDRLIDRVGLGDVAGKPYRILSGGERQRLALALALVGRPEIAILDEPTAGMDPAARARTRELIAGLRADGTSVLLTTHDLGDVEAIADRVAILVRGRLVAVGPPAALAADGDGDLVVRFARPLTALEHGNLQAAIPGAVVPIGAAGLLVAGAAGTPAVTAAVATWAAAHGIAIASLETGHGSLEARYLALVGPEEDAAA